MARYANYWIRIARIPMNGHTAYHSALFHRAWYHRESRCISTICQLGKLTPSFRWRSVCLDLWKGHVRTLTSTTHEDPDRWRNKTNQLIAKYGLLRESSKPVFYVGGPYSGKTSALAHVAKQVIEQDSRPFAMTHSMESYQTDTNSTALQFGVQSRATRKKGPILVLTPTAESAKVFYDRFVQMHSEDESAISYFATDSKIHVFSVYGFCLELMRQAEGSNEIPVGFQAYRYRDIVPLYFRLMKTHGLRTRTAAMEMIQLAESGCIGVDGFISLSAATMVLTHEHMNKFYKMKRQYFANTAWTKEDVKAKALYLLTSSDASVISLASSYESLIIDQSENFLHTSCAIRVALQDIIPSQHIALDSEVASLSLLPPIANDEEQQIALAALRSLPNEHVIPLPQMSKVVDAESPMTFSRSLPRISVHILLDKEERFVEYSSKKALLATRKLNEISESTRGQIGVADSNYMYPTKVEAFESYNRWWISQSEFLKRWDHHSCMLRFARNPHDNIALILAMAEVIPVRNFSSEVMYDLLDISEVTEKSIWELLPAILLMDRSQLLAFQDALHVSKLFRFREGFRRVYEFLGSFRAMATHPDSSAAQMVQFLSKLYDTQKSRSRKSIVSSIETETNAFERLRTESETLWRKMLVASCSKPRYAGKNYIDSNGILQGGLSNLVRDIENETFSFLDDFSAMQSFSRSFHQIQSSELQILLFALSSYLSVARHRKFYKHELYKRQFAHQLCASMIRAKESIEISVHAMTLEDIALYDSLLASVEHPLIQEFVSQVDELRRQHEIPKKCAPKKSKRSNDKKDGASPRQA